MRGRTILTAVAAIGVTLCGAVAVAPSASAQGAPIVWHQAVVRASADAPCPTTSDADKAAGWTAWTGSWDQWPNDGKGGYVCTRSITWAYEADTAGADAGGGCIMLTTIPIYVEFGGGFSLGSDQVVNAYLDAACADLYRTAPVGENVVWAPVGEGQALVRCHAAFGDLTAPTRPSYYDLGPAIYVCSLTV